MHIVTAANEAYAQHLGVMLFSLLKHAKHKKDINLYVIDGNISKANKRKLERITGLFNRTITFLKVDDKLIETFLLNKASYISKETYYRIFIPQLLDERIDKALYLDCDIIVQDDLTELWDTPIKGHYLGAVSKSLSKEKRKKREKRLNMPEGSLYFNCGVLLLNLRMWREKNMVQKIVTFIQNNPSKLKFLDQDAMNSVLQGKWVKLKARWNYTSKRLPHFWENPAVIHFTSSRKPWNWDGHPFRKLYFKYLKESKWNKEK